MQKDIQDNQNVLKLRVHVQASGNKTKTKLIIATSFTSSTQLISGKWLIIAKLSIV